MDKILPVNLTNKAWSLPILAALHQGTAGRQAPLINATGAGRGAFAQSMTHLQGLGLIERNSGHGHPLRPEFQLTKTGIAIAARAAQIVNLARSDEERILLRRAWSLPVLCQLNEPRRFSNLRIALTPITDRALSQTLQSLENHNWVRRAITSSRPPRPIYHAVNSGAQIARIGIGI